jgi:hypothetical protein
MKTMAGTWLNQAQLSRSFAIALLSLVLSANPAWPADGSATAPKTHTLFMGADLAVEHDGKLQPVEDVVGTMLRIRPDGKNVVSVPLSRDRNLRVNETLKVATMATSVEVPKLVVERAYTPENDPFRKFVNASRVSAAVSDMQELSQARADAAASALAGAAASAAPVDENYKASLQLQLDSAQAALNLATNLSNSDMMNTGSLAGRMSGELAQERFDAIRLAFEVKSPRSMARPYFIFIAQFREPGTKQGAARKWVMAKSLDALEANVPVRLDLTQGGFTPGFVLESSSLHLYNDGVELATNVSRKRVDMTEDEAMQYQIIEYISANKGQTVPAKPMATKLSREQREQVMGGQFSETYYVRVTKQGAVDAVFLDADGKRPLQDAKLEAVVKTLRFNPALQAGKPIEAIAPVKLGNLTAF